MGVSPSSGDLVSQWINGRHTEKGTLFSLTPCSIRQSVFHWPVTGDLDSQDGQSVINAMINVRPIWQGTAYQARRWVDTLVSQTIAHGHWSYMQLQVMIILRSLCVCMHLVVVVAVDSLSLISNCTVAVVIKILHEQVFGDLFGCRHMPAPA